MITLTLTLDILVLLSLDAKSERSEKQAHFLATMEKNPNPHSSTLIYENVPSTLRRKPQVCDWWEEGGNCDILSMNLGNKLTDSYTFYWEIEGKNNFTEVRQKTQTTFSLHSIIHTSIKQEPEGRDSVNIRRGVTSPPWGWLSVEIRIIY